MTIVWRDVFRHFLQVVAFCCVVAVLTTAIWPRHHYVIQLGYALSIGLIIWLVIEFGRLLVDQRHCHRGIDGQPGWPAGWRGVALTAAGIGAGFLVGEPLGQWLFHGEVAPSAQDNWASLAITVAAGAVASYYFHTRSKAAALQAEIAAAERDATEARLRLLQSQLEPHMLFNTLANLRALIGVDPPAAQRMVDRLNDYLRATLDASRATTHPLSAEFERLRDYLDLMAIRMGPRLAASFDLPEALRDLPVPPLILQPLVENAIRHGLEPQVAGGRIDVRAERVGDTLRLTVADTGAGFDATHVREGRFGMAQVIERVASSTGGRGVVHVQSAPGAGTTVALELPIDQASA
ncbi:sensor histidine kinase [Ottowia beijingensis]|uniref:sensor histidine kinase n=1 Tax=Ottowia beijingensis TaxID=1207057 RepID=UPI002FD91396